MRRDKTGEVHSDGNIQKDESWRKELEERDSTNRPQMNATDFGNHSWRGLKEALGGLGGQDPKEARGIGFGSRMGTILEPSWTPLVTVWQHRRLGPSWAAKMKGKKMQK